MKKCIARPGIPRPVAFRFHTSPHAHPAPYLLMQSPSAHHAPLAGVILHY